MMVIWLRVVVLMVAAVLTVSRLALVTKPVLPDARSSVKVIVTAVGGVVTVEPGAGVEL